MKAFLSARKLFNQLDNSSYHPHLSLMYSDVSLERKRKIANQIKLSKKSTILIDRVSLVQTIGAVEEWKVIKNIKLKITSA
jgi:2'-5' RNA ligase